jgi:hypothetical protein
VSLPFWYPDEFRLLVGETFIFDSFGASLTAAGFPPVEIPVALAFCAGLWAFRRTSSIAAAFLVSIYVLATVLLGPAGPSLTRFLVVLPVILVFSAMGLASLLEGRRTATRFAAAALLAGALWRGREYGIAFSRGAPGRSTCPKARQRSANELFPCRRAGNESSASWGRTPTPSGF